MDARIRIWIISTRNQAYDSFETLIFVTNPLNLSIFVIKGEDNVKTTQAEEAHLPQPVYRGLQDRRHVIQLDVQQLNGIFFYALTRIWSRLGGFYQIMSKAHLPQAVHRGLQVRSRVPKLKGIFLLLCINTEPIRRRYLKHTLAKPQ